ncbi:hypothetical protein [Kribbella sp. NPDC004536]|uniref:hypothetical protein n=1 Tax=Kribbella sp. NPDC004536 TaxID=3364106 RepID=UPI0036A9252F
MEEQTYAKFSASRVRSVITAPIATLLALALLPRDFFDLSKYPVTTVILDVLFVVFLYVAVRTWIVVIRGPVNLRLAADGLTMRRGRRELTLPWADVSLVRISWKSKVPWVVVWLAEAVPADRVPVRAERDGSYRVLPIGRGRSVRRRMKQAAGFRTEIMGYAGRYIDVSWD